MDRKKLILLWSLLAVAFAAGGVLLAGADPDQDTRLDVKKKVRGPRAMFLRSHEAGGWLGVTLSDVDAEKARTLKLPGEYGAVVMEVGEESPAAKAGLAKDDVILEYGGEKVGSATKLRRLVRETPPGRSVALLVSRAGQTRTVTVALGERSRATFHLPAPPPPPSMAAPTPTPGMRAPDFDFVWHARGARLGISADELTPQLAEYFGVKQGKGVLVREVVVGSAAEKAGLKAGDVIVRVDEKDVASVRGLRRALRGEPEEKRKVTLTLVRDKREQTLAVELEPARPPEPRMTTEVGPIDIDVDDVEAWAEDMAEGAAELAEAAEEWKEDWKENEKEIQEELRYFNDEELPRLKEEIKREGEKIKRELRKTELALPTETI